MNGERLPAVSVLMPVRNGERYLAAALSSILAQTLTDIEVVVLDDGSTDGTPDILAGFARDDDRISVHRRQPSGLVATLNDGLRLCRAALVARMDADDLARSDRLRIQAEAMRLRPSLTVLGGAIRYIDGVGTAGRSVSYPTGAAAIRHLEYGSPIAHPTAMLRRDAVIRLGGYRTWFRHCEDYDLWLRCSEQGEIDNVPDHLLDYRIHPDSVSITNAREQTLRTFVAWGCHLVRVRTGCDPSEGLPADATSALDSLPLTADERQRLLWSLVGHAAHLLGDARANPDCRRWLDELRGRQRDEHARNMLAIHHLRAIRYYRDRGLAAGVLRNAAAAIGQTPAETLNHLLGFLRQWRSHRTDN